MSAVIKLSDRALRDNVDKLGELNAQIKALSKQADAIKYKLVASGYSEIEGKLFRAVISVRSSSRLDSKMVKAFLSAEQIELASKVSESVAVSLYDR